MLQESKRKLRAGLRWMARFVSEHAPPKAETAMDQRQAMEAARAEYWLHAWKDQVERLIIAGGKRDGAIPSLQEALHEMDKFGRQLLEMQTALAALEPDTCKGQAIFGMVSRPIGNAVKAVAALVGTAYNSKVSIAGAMGQAALGRDTDFNRLKESIVTNIVDYQRRVENSAGPSLGNAFGSVAGVAVPAAIHGASELAMTGSLASGAYSAAAAVVPTSVSPPVAVLTGCAIAGTIFWQGMKGYAEGRDTQKALKDAGIKRLAITLFHTNANATVNGPVVFGCRPEHTRLDKTFFEDTASTFSNYVDAVWRLIEDPARAKAIFCAKKGQTEWEKKLDDAIDGLTELSWPAVRIAAKTVDLWIDHYQFGSFLWCSMDIFENHNRSTAGVSPCAVEPDGKGGSLRSLNEAWVPNFIQYICVALTFYTTQRTAKDCMLTWRNDWIRQAKNESAKRKRKADASPESVDAARPHASAQGQNLPPATISERVVRPRSHQALDPYEEGTQLVNIASNPDQKALMEAKEEDPLAPLGMQKVLRNGEATPEHAFIAALYPTNIDELWRQHAALGRHLTTQEVMTMYSLNKLSMMLQCVEAAIARSDGADTRFTHMVVYADDDMQNTGEQQEVKVARKLADVKNYLKYYREELDDMIHGKQAMRLRIIAGIIQVWRQFRHFGVFKLDAVCSDIQPDRE